MRMKVEWFKMFLSFAPLINAIPSENVGEGVKAAMRYFKTSETPDPDFPEMSGAVFEMLKDSIDQAFSDCERKSANAVNANAIRWGTVQIGSKLDPEKNQSQKEKEKKEKKERLTPDVDCGVLSPIAPPPPTPELVVYRDTSTGKEYTLEEYVERWHGIWHVNETTWKVINRFRTKGMTDNLIRFAFDQTVNANPECEDAYFTSVLKDYQANGFTLESQAEQREKALH